MRKVAGKLIWFINLLCAVILLLSYASPFIHPGKILFPALLGLVYPYILLINLAFVIYWLVLFKKELFLSLIVILLGWGHLMNLLPVNFSSAKKNTTEDTFSIMSYNVRTFDRFNWTKKKNSREEIFQLVREKDPDILCMQEFISLNKIGMREKDIVRQLVNYAQYSIYYINRTTPETGFGCATFSKFPIIKTSRIPFDSTANQAIYTDLLIYGDTIRLFNMHLQSVRLRQENMNFIDTLSLKYTNEQIKGVQEITGKLRNAYIQRAEQATIIHNYILDSPYPVIVAGDFNDTPLSYSYHKIRKGLQDSFRESGKGLGNTYAGDLPSLRIDFILHSKDIKSTEFTRIKSKHSDHFPIMARLKKHTGEDKSEE